MFYANYYTDGSIRVRVPTRDSSIPSVCTNEASSPNIRVHEHLNTMERSRSKYTKRKPITFSEKNV